MTEASVDLGSDNALNDPVSNHDRAVLMLPDDAGTDSAKPVLLEASRGSSCVSALRG